MLVVVLLLGLYLQVTWSGDICPNERDTSPGSDIYWDEVPAGSVSIQQCPPGAAGNVTRQCVSDQHSPHGGKWEPPDTSQCAGKQFSSVFDKASAALTDRSPHVDPIMEVMQELRNLTEDAAHVYTADLFDGTSMMYHIAAKAAALSDVTFKVDNFSEEFGNTLSSLLGNNTMLSWSEYKDKEYIHSQGILMLYSMEIFANNLINIRSEAPPPFEDLGPEHWDVVRVQADNLAFEVQAIERNSDVPGVLYMGEDGEVSVEYPEEVFVIANDNRLRWMYGVYSAQFSNINQLLEAEGLAKPGFNVSETNIASQILSANVVRVRDGIFNNLTNPVIITFKHQEGIFYNTSAICSFINETAQSNTDRWSDEGCILADQNDTHSICYCYHLTNFALLMDIFKLDLPLVHETALTYISYIGGSLSVLGCCLSIFMYECLRLRGDRVRIHEMLALSIIFTQLTFFIGFERTDSEVLCKAFSIILHYSLTAMFCWMLVEGVHLYASVVKVFRTGPCLKRYMVLGWGVPFLNVLISVLVFYNEYASEKYCWLTTKLLLIAFVPFVAIIIIINTIILVLVIRVMMKSLQSANLSKNRSDDLPTAKTGLKATLILLPLLGLTWVFGFLSVGTGMTLLFTYLFTIANSMQGVMFFLFHCVLNGDVKQAFLRRLGKTTAQTPQSGDSSESQRAHGSGQANDDNNGNKDSRSPNLIRVSVTKRSSATSTESIETNQTNVDESDQNIDSLQDKSEDEISEKALKNFENLHSRHRPFMTMSGGSSASSGSQSSGSTRSDTPCAAMDHPALGSRRNHYRFSLSHCKSLKYRGKAAETEIDKDSQEIQEALDILDSSIIDEENYI